MAKGVIKNRLDHGTLKYVAERIIESGHVINGAAIAKMAGVDKGTVSRGLHALGIPTNGKIRYEYSRDSETRTHEEIARLIREELAKEDPKRTGRLITGIELAVRCRLNCSEQMVRKIMLKFNIPNSWQRARMRKKK